MKGLIYRDFLNDIINGLDLKYQNILKEQSSNTYLYAILPDLPLYYDVFRFSKKYSYNMYEKIHKTKNYETMKLLKKLTIENEYNSNYLLMLVAYISHMMLDFYLEPYVNSFAKKLTLDGDLRRYKRRYTDFMVGLQNSYYLNRYDKKAISVSFSDEIDPNLNFSEECENAIKLITKDIYYFSFGLDYFKICLKHYKHYGNWYYNDPTGLNRFFLSICELFQPVHRISKRGLSGHVRKKVLGNDYLNLKNNTWTNNNGEDDTRSFTEIYDEALLNSKVVINQILDNIYYKKDLGNDVLQYLKKITDNNMKLLEKKKKKFLKFNLKSLKKKNNENENTADE